MHFAIELSNRFHRNFWLRSQAREPSEFPWTVHHKCFSKKLHLKLQVFVDLHCGTGCWCDLDQVTIVVDLESPQAATREGVRRAIRAYWSVRDQNRGGRIWKRRFKSVCLTFLEWFIYLVQSVVNFGGNSPAIQNRLRVAQERHAAIILLVTCHGGTSRWFKKPVKRIYRIWIQRLGKLTLSILQTRKVLSQFGCGRSICQLYLDLLNLIIHLRFICSILGEECHSHRIIRHRHQECHVHRITRNRAVVLQLNIEIWQTW